MNLWVMLESVRFIMLHAVFKEFRSKCSWTKPYTQEVSYHMMVSWISSFSGAKTPLIGDLSSFSLEKALGVKYQFLLINTNIHVLSANTKHSPVSFCWRKTLQETIRHCPKYIFCGWSLHPTNLFPDSPPKICVYIYIHTYYIQYIYICYTPPPPKDRPVPWFFSS